MFPNPTQVAFSYTVESEEFHSEVTIFVLKTGRRKVQITDTQSLFDLVPEFVYLKMEDDCAEDRRDELSQKFTTYAALGLDVEDCVIREQMILCEDLPEVWGWAK